MAPNIKIIRTLRRSSAFSLVELLVAISIAIVIGGAILSALLHTFGVWESVGQKTGELREVDNFDIDFSRDFASAAHQLGFAGTADSCIFWTIRPAYDKALKLVRVKYSIDKKGICSETWDLSDSPNENGKITRYGTTMPMSFSYGDTNSVDGVWIPNWQSPSNTPIAVSIKLQSTPPMPAERFYERRTR